MWALKGRIVALADDRSVAPSEDSVFAGRVWIEDDRIVAVTRGRAAGPPGSEGVVPVDVGSSLVLPGLIDLHNHLAYNTLPLWSEPTQTRPWAHHNAWPRAASYARSTTWPAYALITACPQELLGYVEAKAIVGGTTSIQGSPPHNRPRDGWLVRNIEDESFGSGDANRIYASVLTADAATLAKRANAMRDRPTGTASAFIYHCAEGRPESIVAREFTDAERAGCLQPRFVAVHANAADPAGFGRWQPPGAVAWSPFSNLWLYGTTTDVPAARAAGVTVCLGSDWAPSGTKNVLGELKSARLTADHFGWDLPDAELVKMATCHPGDVLRRAWSRQVGRLQPGAQADLLVLRARPRVSAFAHIVAATDDDVDLVVIDGRLRYGTPELMESATTTTDLTVNTRSMRLSLCQPSDPTQAWSWSEVLERLEEVRADPKHEVETAQAMYARWAGRLDQVAAPLRLALDMPTGLAPVGGLPKDLGQITIPALETLTHDAGWLAGLSGRGFHDGVLDGLNHYYGG